MKAAYITNFSKDNRAESITDSMHGAKDFVFRDHFGNILHLEDNRIRCILCRRKQVDTLPLNRPDDRVIFMENEAAEITEEDMESTKLEDIQRCLHAGILPNCLENGNVRIEVQELGTISCFIRHEDGTVTCSMGRELLKLRDTKYGTEYSSREA